MRNYYHFYNFGAIFFTGAILEKKSEMKRIRQRNQSISILPNEIFIEIFLYIPARHVLSTIVIVSKRCHYIIRNPIFYRLLTKLILSSFRIPLSSLSKDIIQKMNTDQETEELCKRVVKDFTYDSYDYFLNHHPSQTKYSNPEYTSKSLFTPREHELLNEAFKNITHPIFTSLEFYIFQSIREEKRLFLCVGIDNFISWITTIYNMMTECIVEDIKLRSYTHTRLYDCVYWLEFVFRKFKYFKIQRKRFNEVLQFYSKLFKYLNQYYCLHVVRLDTIDIKVNELYGNVIN